MVACFLPCIGWAAVGVFVDIIWEDVGDPVGPEDGGVVGCPVGLCVGMAVRVTKDLLGLRGKRERE